ncbi:uncharacterized protein BP01DRAFT_356313 [Aspergillus saccharolyticus JOP 1030-1]|uniref:Ketose-bisphosphate aldolase class-II family protein n=1 Tax=Aspergillus saccharolyticus JOP 1030-1 TaxID=1450539 RepID=A0A318ZDU1_9EURO|nr:hypothetical protein BP01DRAFT_356313 [Aspergillus saccharolyticus JOP 1030-1]PYH45686.1 hypothetical protein BP01DRAFT_356313 [Aspergillus saccharolyticus JOP 1030-1]
MASIRSYPVLSRRSTLASLPPESTIDAQAQIARLLATTSPSRLVVLDDDPTGTQTCHDVAVLTVWDIDTLVHEFRQPSRGFFILTNSRAFPASEAEPLIRTICANVAEAARRTDQSVDIVLRGDSTLRGHFPLEADVAQSVFGPAAAIILAPFFFQGGRFTIDDVHYVVDGEDALVPAGDTPFARDATFGFQSSNLRDYVMEKAGPGRFTPPEIHSITIEDIRLGGQEVVCEKILRIPEGHVVIVNAAAESDMHVFVAGLLLAKSHSPSGTKQKQYLHRTAASFVSTRLAIPTLPPLTATALGLCPRTPTTDSNSNSNSNSPGAFILAGSYVPKTTAQLNCLTTRHGPNGTNSLAILTLDVPALLHSYTDPDLHTKTIASLIHEAQTSLLAGKDTLVMTSRDLVTSPNTGGQQQQQQQQQEQEEENPNLNLQIGSRVAGAMVEVLRGVVQRVRPRYIIAKGGITSSDAATKGLGIKRAMVVGQAAPGVPVWRCNEPTSRHAGIPFVVFPGNVGGEETLSDLVEAWS